MTKEKRTLGMFSQLWDELFPLVAGRFLLPKNEQHGTWKTIEPMKHYRWMQHEALEASQAYRNKEGIDREIEECCDVLNITALRLDNLLRLKESEL